MTYREPRTAYDRAPSKELHEYVDRFLNDNPSISSSWVTGLMMDGFSDRVVRDFCNVLILLGKLGERFDRDELLGSARGLYFYLPTDTELNDLTGRDRLVAEALGKVTSAVWLYTPESPTDGVTDDDEEGIHLADSRTAALVMEHPEQWVSLVAFVQQRGESSYEEITRFLALSPALREGDL